MLRNWNLLAEFNAIDVPVHKINIKAIIINNRAINPSCSIMTASAKSLSAAKTLNKKEESPQLLQELKQSV